MANRERRTREYLTPQEVEKLIRAASRVGRYGHRDATLILLAYRHGLRVSELVALRWTKSISIRASYTSPGSKTECRQRTRFEGLSYGRCDGFDASKVRRHTSSPPSVGVR
jgi:integrase